MYRSQVCINIHGHTPHGDLQSHAV